MQAPIQAYNVLLLALNINTLHCHCLLYITLGTDFMKIRPSQTSIHGVAHAQNNRLDMSAGRKKMCGPTETCPI